MALEEEFRAASQEVQKLSRRPENTDLLGLYGLFKQATEGNVSGNRPGILDIKGRAKYDAWASRKGMTPEAAMAAYIAFVRKLQATNG